MLIPKFSIGKDRLYITPEYLCNGHWLVKKAAARSPAAPKAFKPLLIAQTGSYFNGLSGGLDRSDTIDVTQAIPSRDGYVLMSPDPVGVEFKNSDTVAAYIFQCGEFKIGVNPNYVPIMRLGHAFAKEARSPILILEGNSLNDELVGVVMPLRLREATNG